MGRILGFAILIDLALVIGAIADCLGGEREPRRFNRPLWVAVILLVPIAGPVTWFMAGRYRPERSRPAPRTSLAPDDDAEFLRDLERRLREDKDDQ